MSGDIVVSVKQIDKDALSGSAIRYALNGWVRWMRHENGGVVTGVLEFLAGLLNLLIVPGPYQGAGFALLNGGILVAPFLWMVARAPFQQRDLARRLYRESMSQSNAERSSNPASSNGGSKSPGRVNRRVLIVLAVGVFLVLGDWLLRNLEMNALVDTVEDSERVIVQQQNVLRNAMVTEGGSVFLEDRIRSSAETAASRVLEAQGVVDDVSVVFWHPSINRAKTRYLAHSNAWSELLTDISQNPNGTERSYPEIAASFSNAERAFHRAVPPFPLFGLKPRIEKIFLE